MALERQSIEKRDFPVGRRGYDPDAVDAHLTAVADEVEELKLTARRRSETLASAASEQVRVIVEVAENTAAEIQRQAEDDAREIRAEALAEAQSTREQASGQARDYVGKVSESTAVMLQRLDAMESELSTMIDSLRQGAGRLAGDLQLLGSNIGDVGKAVETRPKFEPEPESAPTPEPEPTPEGQASPAPDPVAAAAEAEPSTPEQAEPGPVWADEEPEVATEPGSAAAAEPEATPGDAEPEAKPGDAEPEAAQAGSASPEVDVSAQAEPTATPAESEEPEGAAQVEPAAGSDGEPRADGEPQADGADESQTTDDDSEGARLIALNMALNGTSRADTDRYLADNFRLRDRAALLDDVYAAIEP